MGIVLNYHLKQIESMSRKKLLFLKSLMPLKIMKFIADSLGLKLHIPTPQLIKIHC